MPTDPTTIDPTQVPAGTNGTIVFFFVLLAVFMLLLAAMALGGAAWASGKEKKTPYRVCMIIAGILLVSVLVILLYFGVPGWLILLYLLLSLLAITATSSRFRSACMAFHHAFKRDNGAGTK